MRGYTARWRPEEGFLVGIDPGFASLGAALLRPVDCGAAVDVVDLRIIETEKGDEHLAFDIARRSRLLEAALGELLRSWPRHFAFVEGLTMARGAVAMTKLGCAHGIVWTSLARCAKSWGSDVLEPKEVRELLRVDKRQKGESADLNKLRLEAKALEQISNRSEIGKLLGRYKKADREHAVDAVAVGAAAHVWYQGL